jgi:hypothetical protein
MCQAKGQDIQTIRYATVRILRGNRSPAKPTLWKAARLEVLLWRLLLSWYAIPLLLNGKARTL